MATSIHSYFVIVAGSFTSPSLLVRVKNLRIPAGLNDGDDLTKDSN